jgi:hypothetical protein
MRGKLAAVSQTDGTNPEFTFLAIPRDMHVGGLIIFV